jgi:hypothetical protein
LCERADAVPDVVPDIGADVVTDGIPYVIADVCTDGIPDVLPDGIADIVTDGIPDGVPDITPLCNTNRIPYCMSNNLTFWISYFVPDIKPNRCTHYISHSTTNINSHGSANIRL